jgi:hypothetical protein|uniref:HNH domain-containing protein n=1 Tax=viral metagenome TaxID=1070528 RepID=A0A6C0CVL1_9ZZZZ
MNYDEKKINIVGTGTRYQMKKVIKNDDDYIIKSRKEIDKLDLPLDIFEWEQQHNIINEIYENLKNNYVLKTSPDIIKIFKNQISNKLSGYKQQDTMKKVFDKDKIIKMEEVIEKLKNCGLKCYYCNENIYLLYKLVREMNQWSLDRINNDIGHTCENVFISCLECNLKKRTKNSDSFLFTKQLKINKLCD